MNTPPDSALPSPAPVPHAAGTASPPQAVANAVNQADALKTAVTLAELLQRVEASTQAIGAAQYQRLAVHLTRLLANLPPSARLTALLNTFPAAAVLYENARYAQAGLCRVPLELSLASELSARDAINRARSVAAAR